jgi:hypothetical protein
MLYWPAREGETANEFVGCWRYRVGMASPAAALPSDHEPVPPPPDPQAIRACLTQDVAAAFYDAAVRRWVFGLGGPGQVVYLILEDQREVHEILVLWLG